MKLLKISGLLVLLALIDSGTLIIPLLLTMFLVIKIIATCFGKGFK